MSSKKKILHVLHSLEKGGITSFVEELVNLNQSTNTNHHILVWQKAPREDYKSDCIDISKSTDRKNQYENIIKDYDKIFVHSLMPFMIWSLFKRKKDVFLFQHGISFGQGFNKIVKQLYYTFVINFFGFKIICSSNFAKQKLLRKIPVLNKKLILIIGFGININQKENTNKSSDNVLRIGFAGRLVEQKRISKIINALKLVNSNIEIEFHIAGDGPQLKELQLKAEEFKGSKTTFVFHGFLKNMDDYYSKLDVFILPSIGESFGLVVLEAICRKIPTIVFSDSGACVEFISEGVNGYIVESEEALSKKIEDLSVTSLRKELKLNMKSLNLIDYDISETRFNLDAL